MFDLNLTLDSTDDDHFDATNCDGWSRESSSNDDAVLAFNSDISNSSDQIPSDSGLVTRELFPVSRLGELDRLNETADHVSLHYSSPQAAVQQEVQQVQAVQARKSRRGPRSRSSQYRGVTFYRRTGRWESHIWDCGKQVYLGGFDTALAAARAYDRAAIKFRGVEADINFNLNDYHDMKQMMNLSKEEFVQTLRRQSNGFSRGSCKYKLNKCGRWDTRTGEHLGMKVYDKAGIMCNGSDPNAYHIGEATLESRYGGSQHDLNLNLGMSASSQNENGWLEDSSRLHHVAQTTTTSKLHMGSNILYDPPLEGVPTRFQHHLCTPNFAPNNEERDRSGSIYQLERMQGHDPTAQKTAAASSGFSSIPNTPAWINPYLPPS